MFIWYGCVLYWIAKKRLEATCVWIMIFGLSATLLFAYPAFSYDLFNHMFSAKSVLLYHKNPYMVTPLQFAGYESWLTFMRWTHIVSTYSPLWIVVTLIPYFFGLGYFLLIMWNFKLLMAIFYILTLYSIWKILEKESDTVALSGIAVFAFNPLVIIESLVSAHNDIVMMGCAVFALYIFTRQKAVLSFFMLSVSVAVKLMTIVLIPMYILPKIKWIPLVCMTAGTFGFLIVTKREVMPWYFLWILPFIALYPMKRWLIILAFGTSFGLLLRYAPYLYFGHWDAPVPSLKVWASVIPIMISLLIIFTDLVKYRRHK